MQISYRAHLLLDSDEQAKHAVKLLEGATRYPALQFADCIPDAGDNGEPLLVLDVNERDSDRQLVLLVQALTDFHLSGGSK